jgi:hypothetical protein
VRRRLILAVVLGCGLVALACLPRLERSARGVFYQPVTTLCGVERWRIKTLQDRPRLIAVQRTTIAWLVSRPRPASLPPARLPFERRIFQVVAAVTLVRLESDNDYHLVLRTGPKHMIAEAALPTCATRATPLRIRQMRRARQAVRLCRQARVTGVAFFDFNHGQTGVAPNAIELHPVLAFKCLSA